MSRHKAEIGKLADQAAYHRRAAENRQAEIDRIEDRIREEYQQHVPVIDSSQPGLMLGNSGSLHVTCAALNCPHFWPRPQWHMLRRIYGYDKSTYELELVRTKEDFE